MKKAYNKETVIEALTMYKDNRPLKEIQEKLSLPSGNHGESLISQWRRRAGLPARQPSHNWQNIRQAIIETGG